MVNFTKINNIKNLIIFLLLGIIFFLIFSNKTIEKTQEKKTKDPINKSVEKTQEKKVINFCQQFINKKKYYKVWSETKPKINKTHIFCGEINSKGKASGFHSQFNGINPPTIKILEKKDTNKKGIYTAKIEILDIKKNIYKQKFSSIFPDNLNIEETEKIILNAWENKKYYKKSKFKGPSGLGFDIEGYTLKGKINTAYPIYKK